MTVSEQIGLNLRKVRRSAVMSQEDLSRRAGLNRTEIGMLECGLSVPRLDTCIKILGSTGVDPEVLFEDIAWHGPMYLDEEGWFAIVAIDGPVDLRSARRARGNR